MSAVHRIDLANTTHRAIIRSSTVSRNGRVNLPSEVPSHPGARWPYRLTSRRGSIPGKRLCDCGAGIATAGAAPNAEITPALAPHGEDEYDTPDARC